ncbi:GNAT family N-acetyltransferase [Sphingobium sp. H39-3-25]|uniref:GNAT family N-acetyltransferase n=1 Tax=Sphingobium arseniciresistens TaxID=3030834 RepID=UPI0023B8D4A3|nr:GNAT family N-acetyltransferase [Sphingobium arseniciresistens]
MTPPPEGSPPPGSWRAMHPADIPAVTAISDAVHGAFAETALVYAERLALYPSGCISLEQDGQVTGFLVSHPWLRDQPPALNAPLGPIPEDADTYYLHDIALLPRTRGTGAGTAALAHAMALARAGGFQDVTLIAVNGADSFWSARGFHHVASGDGEGEPISYGPGTFLMRRAVDTGA